MVKITFPDGSSKEFEQGVTGMQIAESISPKLAKEVLVASVNGQLYDLMRPINQDSTVELHKWDDPQGKKAFWHSSAHLLAEALRRGVKALQFAFGRIPRLHRLLVVLPQSLGLLVEPIEVFHPE